MKRMIQMAAGIGILLGASAHADAPYWRWYPEQGSYQPYGHTVKLSNRGRWVHRDGSFHFARVNTGSATMIDPMNTDDRNGRLAYAAAYSAYRKGKAKGTNRVETAKGGRWKKKITTERGIVLLTDDWNNVAVRTPDGKWHVTDDKGRYAASSVRLPGLASEPDMVASVFYSNPPEPEKESREEIKIPDAASPSSSPNRMPASLADPVYAD